VFSFLQHTDHTHSINLTTVACRISPSARPYKFCSDIILQRVWHTDGRIELRLPRRR